jgi:hypothetical protein
MFRAFALRCSRAIAVFAAAAARSGCIVYPARGPRYSFYHHPRASYCG